MIIHHRGKESLTDYEVLERFWYYIPGCNFAFIPAVHTRYRVHMKDLGHPVVCDELYGDGKPLLLSSLKSKFKLSKNELEERPLLSRLALHAFQLNFTDLSGKKLELEAPLHKDLKATLQQLGKTAKKHR